MPVVVGDSNLDGIVLKTSEGTALRGRIVVEDGVTPPKADLIRVDTVPIEWDSAPVAGGPSPSKTNDDYTFEVLRQNGIRRILPGVQSPDWMLKKITFNGQDVTDAGVDFRTKDVEGVEITLTSKVTHVTGGVSDDKGPVSDYVVVIFASDPTKWIDRSRFVGLVRPAQQGRFRANGLPPEDYLAIALPSVNGPEFMDPDFLQQLRAQASSFTLGEGETKTLELKLKRRP
jgi:hypothetical protein